MGSERNQVILLDSKGRVEELPELSKEEVAERILQRVIGLVAGIVEE